MVGRTVQEKRVTSYQKRAGTQGKDGVTPLHALFQAGNAGANGSLDRSVERDKTRIETSSQGSRTVASVEKEGRG